MTPEEQKDFLLRVVIRVAGQQLESGGLMPFGATLGAERDVKLLMPKSFKKDSTRDEVESYWAQELRIAIADGSRETACSCADVRVPMEDGSFVPGVLVHIEHAESSAEDILYPYYNHDGSVLFREPTRVVTKRHIFIPQDQEVRDQGPETR
jgi:hypothetical protein